MVYEAGERVLGAENTGDGFADGGCVDGDGVAADVGVWWSCGRRVGGTFVWAWWQFWWAFWG